MKLLLYVLMPLPLPFAVADFFLLPIPLFFSGCCVVIAVAPVDAAGWYCSPAVEVVPVEPVSEPTRVLQRIQPRRVRPDLPMNYLLHQDQWTLAPRQRNALPQTVTAAMSARGGTTDSTRVGPGSGAVLVRHRDEEVHAPLEYVTRCSCCLRVPTACCHPRLPAASGYRCVSGNVVCYVCVCACQWNAGLCVQRFEHVCTVCACVKCVIVRLCKEYVSLCALVRTCDSVIVRYCEVNCARV